MLYHQNLFFRFLAQTSTSPLALDIEKAESVYLYGRDGKKYIDLISGIAVSNTGHRHPHITAAIKKQLDSNLHLMVYGEYIQVPQLQFAKALTEILPEILQSIYFVNSGSEAVEGALKTAKRFTGRSEIVAFNNAYHGSTQGALSVMGNEYFKQAFRPLLPDIRFIQFNKQEDLQHITEKTACVIMETIQGEAGIIIPAEKYMGYLRKRCNETGTLLILDEVQTGFGRTGKMFAFEHYSIVPDILVLGKALGGGMPLGAFVAPKKIMSSLTTNPELGHITTFGGHPVCCASALAALEVLFAERLPEQAEKKEKHFREKLVHPRIKNIRAKGLLIALEFSSEEFNKRVIKTCIENGVIVDWFLFAGNCMRIAPPLVISYEEINKACDVIIKSIQKHS